MNVRCLCQMAVGVCMVVTGGWTCIEADTQTRGKRLVGGACEYRSYPGEARIVSVEREPSEKKASSAKASKKRYDVTYVFHTRRTIEEPYARIEGKPRRLLLMNGTKPGARFLEKYGIEEGKTFPCRLEVIKSGTCTPVMVDFPTIDLTDYSLP